MAADMLRVAVYARFSSDMQRETSLDDQIAAARRHAVGQGWTVDDAHVFTDAAVSGASIDRPGIQRLLVAAALRPCPFDVLIVDDSSRVSRDLADAVRFLQQLRFFGVRVIYISQQIDSASDQAETLAAVHGIVDSLYLREMAAKIKRGLRGQLERGFATGSITFGYRTIPVPDPSGKMDPNGGPRLLGKRVEVVPDEARVIVQIFDWFVQGLGLTTITDRLNIAGRRGPRGKPWRRGAARRVLVNERYCGRLIWGSRRFERVPGTRQKLPRAVPRADWHVLDRPDLQIVTPDLWSRAQQRLAEIRALTVADSAKPLMRGRNAALHSKNLFSGFMRCGTCGGAVTAVNAGHGSPRYGCSRSWHNGRTACANRLTVRAKVADPLLLEGLRAELVKPDTIAYLSAALSAALNQTIDDRPRLLTEAQTAREQTAQRLQRLVAAIESGVAPATLTAALREREADLARLDADITALAEPIHPRLAVIPRWVENQLQDLAGLLKDTPERVKLEFRRLGVSVVMQPISDEGPTAFYRAIGAASLAALTGTRDLVRPASVLSVEESDARRTAPRWAFSVDLPANIVGPGRRRRVG